MKTRLRSFLALAALFTSVSCEKSAAPPAVEVANPAEMEKTQAELAAARDALQRQALEIDTKTALMDKQLAEMTQTLKDRENAELRGSLDALKKQNDDLRAQADAARRQSNAIAQKTAPLPRRNPAPVVPPASDYSLFYDRLAPYGRWFDVSGYGYCWQPAAATPRWRPYVDGCWAWSSLGWTWQSNEPFGWATYHYGRWVNLSRHGWVWVPGAEWAPAWVSWRQSRDHVGWAPLPPERGSFDGVYRDCDSRYNLGPSSYTFIPTNHFSQPSYSTVCAPVTRNTTIFQSSVNVTQIVRCDDQPRRNVFKHHGGPSRAQMERVNTSPVPQMQVHTASADQIPQHEREHRREGRTSQPVILDLPAAKTGAPPVRPQIAEHIDKPRRVDAFEGVPQRVAEKIRETIAAEKVAAVVQQQPVVAEPSPPVVAQPAPAPAPVAPPVVTQETVRPAIAAEAQPAETVMPAAPAAEARPDRHRHESRQAVDPVVAKPAVAEKPAPPVMEAPAPSSQPAPAAAAEAPPAVVTPVPPAAAETTMPQPVAAEKMAAAEAQRQQKETLAAQQRAADEKMAAEQAQAAAEAERARQQAETAAMQRQQEEQAAQQRATAEKMAAEQAQAAAEAERARQQAEAAAMQRQQEEQAAQQRATAEKMATEQAQAAAEAERARQQAEAAAMQRQQEETARRATEEQMRHEQEMAQRRAEEDARRQAEAEMRRAQEMAQRQAEEQARREQEEQIRQQEMAVRAAQEEARRQAEVEMRRSQEMAQRQAEEQARRAAEEQMRRAQEEVQRAAQEAAQRAAEEVRRQAQEAARRAAEEAARNQPQPPNPGS